MSNQDSQSKGESQNEVPLRDSQDELRDDVDAILQEINLDPDTSNYLIYDQRAPYVAKLVTYINAHTLKAVKELETKVKALEMFTHQAITEARKDQIMRCWLDYDVNINVDESITLAIRDAQLATLTQQTESSDR